MGGIPAEVEKAFRPSNFLGGVDVDARVAFGGSTLEIEIPGHVRWRPLETPDARLVPCDRQAIRDSLRNPIGAARIRDGARGNVSIVVNDITRPTPSQMMLEEILLELDTAGVKRENIRIVIANGSHRPCTKAEIEGILGPGLARELQVTNHDCHANDLVYLGKTPRGIPLFVNSIVARSDYRIVTGVIVPHQAAGYSGGRKSILPGVCGIETIRVHHSMPIRLYEPVPGVLKGNRFHEEAMEAALILGVNFMLNVVPGGDGRLAAAVAGDIAEAFEVGVRAADEIFRVRVDSPADVVLVSPGGYPRDIDLYQSVKSLSTAQMVVKEGGTLVLVAECREGIGKSAFYEWFQGVSSPEEVIERFRLEGFTSGSNTAFILARALAMARVIAVTPGIKPAQLREMLVEPAVTPEEALKIALMGNCAATDLIVIPSSGRLVPVVASRGGITH